MTRREPRTIESLLGTIQKMTGRSPASVAAMHPSKRERVVALALEGTKREDAAHARQDRKAQKRRRDALRSIRGRQEPGHPGCTCTGPETVWEPNRGGHAAGCPGYGAWSREDQLEELYGAKL